MASFYITKDEDTVAYYSPIVKYGHYDLIPAEYWNGQLITPSMPIGRNPKHFCESIRVFKGRSPYNPIMYVVDIQFDKPMDVEKLMKEWKANPPKFENFKGAKALHKKLLFTNKLGKNIYA